MSGKSLVIVVGVVLALLAGLAMTPQAHDFRRRMAANKLYEHAVAEYMHSNIEESRSAFAEIAAKHEDLPIGALAELKLAFFAYDEDKDLDRAEALLEEFLERHPDGVMFFLEWPSDEYEGPLELVAEFLLGRIAYDRGNVAEARARYERIAADGRSKDPANLIVSEAKTLLRRMNESAQPGGSTGE